MICLFALACVAIGIIIIAFGRIPMGTNREVKGTPAYVVAGLLIAILPLGPGVAFLLGYLDRMLDQGGENMPIAAVVDYAGPPILALAAVIVALVNAESKRRKKRRRIVDDGYDDFDRRGQKRWDEIEDEEESRRLKSDDEPRRQRPSYDDDDDDRRGRHY